MKGTSCESTVKAFSRRKDGRGAYLALISNHAGEVKYRSLYKQSLSYLQNVKWSGNQFPLETHVSKHRKAHDQIQECSTHVACQVLSAEQKVEHLLDSISCSDNGIQATLALIRSDRLLRADFEQAASNLIEADPFRRNKSNNQRKRPLAHISSIDFNAGRGNSGVDLRWHTRKEFNSLTAAQKDELSDWLRTTAEGKKCKQKAVHAIKQRQKDKGSHNNTSKKQVKNIEKNLREVFSVLLSQKDADGDVEMDDDSKSKVSDASAKIASAVATGTNLQGILKNGSIFKKKI